MATVTKSKKKKPDPLITYSDAVEGRKKIEKIKNGNVSNPLTLFTEEMFIGMLECGVVLDGFSAGVIREIVLAWDSVGWITTKRGKKMVKRIRAGQTTKRQLVKKKK